MNGRETREEGLGSYKRASSLDTYKHSVRHPLLDNPTLPYETTALAKPSMIQGQSVPSSPIQPGSHAQRGETTNEAEDDKPVCWQSRDERTSQ
jgi:hypothetical protein